MDRPVFDRFATTLPLCQHPQRLPGRGAPPPPPLFAAYAHRKVEKIGFPGGHVVGQHQVQKVAVGFGAGAYAVVVQVIVRQASAGVAPLLGEEPAQQPRHAGAIGNGAGRYYQRAAIGQGNG